MQKYSAAGRVLDLGSSSQQKSKKPVRQLAIRSHALLYILILGLAQHSLEIAREGIRIRLEPVSHESKKNEHGSRCRIYMPEQEDVFDTMNLGPGVTSSRCTQASRSREAKHGENCVEKELCLGFRVASCRKDLGLSSTGDCPS